MKLLYSPPPPPKDERHEVNLVERNKPGGFRYNLTISKLLFKLTFVKLILLYFSSADVLHTLRLEDEIVECILKF
jgi:hypothetical protein